MRIGNLNIQLLNHNFFEMLILGRKRIEAHIRRSIRIPIRLLTCKPNGISDGEYIRNSLDLFLLQERVIEKLVRIFIEFGIQSKTVSFNDTEKKLIVDLANKIKEEGYESD
jgi:hypothetical protein